jgi:hypothetical protein
MNGVDADFVTERAKTKASKSSNKGSQQRHPATMDARVKSELLPRV